MLSGKSGGDCCESMRIHAKNLITNIRCAFLNENGFWVIFEDKLSYRLLSWLVDCVVKSNLLIWNCQTNSNSKLSLQSFERIFFYLSFMTRSHLLYLELFRCLHHLKSPLVGKWWHDVTKIVVNWWNAEISIENGLAHAVTSSKNFLI